MAAKELNCHWQTLWYRERKGDLTPIKDGGRVFYAIGEIRRLKLEAPIKSKPHYSKRVKAEPVQPNNEQTSLWSKIVKFIRACVAR